MRCEDCVYRSIRWWDKSPRYACDIAQPSDDDFLRLPHGAALVPAETARVCWYKTCPRDNERKRRLREQLEVDDAV